MNGCTFVKRLGVIGAVSLASVLGSTRATSQEAILRTVPENPVWNVESYEPEKIHVYLDNRPLDGEKTDAAQWEFVNSPGFPYAGCSLPESDDFFYGLAMWDNVVAPPGSISMRQTYNRGDGPADHTGNLGDYEFYVPMALGTYFVSLQNTKLLDDSFPLGQEQPHVIVNEPVVVSYGLAFYMGCMEGPRDPNKSPIRAPAECGLYESDADGDGDTDLEDYALKTRMAFTEN